MLCSIWDFVFDEQFCLMGQIGELLGYLVWDNRSLIFAMDKKSGI
jgi:hypothetical protein